MILLDTNLLVYALNADAAQHQESRRIVESALEGRLQAVLIPQVLVETYAMLTDPKRVSRPLSPDAAWREIEVYRTAIPLLPWNDQVLPGLGRLLTAAKITGQDVFDTMIVACMHAHNVRSICSYNRTGFGRYPGVDVVSPGTLAKRLKPGS